ncbi:MAG: NAD-dependent epimerase/dehydratase family protein [Saprospiraceae bacterium]|nr:NAD-dependent epimerase/dehydratase family protein [Saprospiraceae bacterium]
MKLLVTGVTGFIGNYVVQELLKRNYSVIATSVSENKAKQYSWFTEVEYLPFDFGSLDSHTDYFNFFGRPDALIHLAWEGLPNYKSSFHLETNLPRHIAFLDNMIRHGLDDISVAGTCLEYGMKEGPLNEGMPSSPVNPYALAKDKLRIELDRLRQQKEFQLKWVRLFYMYGAGQNPNSLLSQLEKALRQGDEVFNMSGGEQKRDFLTVETMAEYLVEIAVQKEVTGIINCCSGQPVTVKKLVENYLTENNKKISLNLGYYPYPDYEPMEFWGDVTKLNKIINTNTRDYE